MNLKNNFNNQTNCRLNDIHPKYNPFYFFKSDNHIDTLKIPGYRLYQIRNLEITVSGLAKVKQKQVNRNLIL